MTIKHKIESALRQNFNPSLLEVFNESYKHSGHSGDNGTGESHFKIVVSAKDITGDSRIEKHRNIIKILGETAKNIHALSIELK